MNHDEIPPDAPTSHDISQDERFFAHVLKAANERLALQIQTLANEAEEARKQAEEARKQAEEARRQAKEAREQALKESFIVKLGEARSRAYNAAKGAHFQAPEEVTRYEILFSDLKTLYRAEKDARKKIRKLAKEAGFLALIK